jgi:hypothetical protein
MQEKRTAANTEKSRFRGIVGDKESKVPQALPRAVGSQGLS